MELVTTLTKDKPKVIRDEGFFYVVLLAAHTVSYTAHSKCDRSADLNKETGESKWSWKDNLCQGLSHQQIEDEQYYVENSHEPIIPKEIFLQVQAEMARRRRFWQDFRYSHSNPLASKTICGSCGLPFRRVGTKWRCDSKLNRKKHPDVECGMEQSRMRNSGKPSLKP